MLLYIDVSKLKKTIGDKNAWMREYLLKEVTSGTSPVNRNLVRYYDNLPIVNKSKHCLLQYVGTGVDLAISKEATAHYTAMVSAKVFWVEDRVNVYILPNPINLKLTFPEAFDLIKKVSKSLDLKGNPTDIIVETVAYQEAMEQMLKEEKYPVKGVKHNSLGKRERLSLVANFMANANIYFPRKGTELLVSQLVGLGSERYDDLADAFVMIIAEIMNSCMFYSYHWDYIAKLPSRRLVWDTIMGEYLDSSESITSRFID